MTVSDCESFNNVIINIIVIYSSPVLFPKLKFYIFTLNSIDIVNKKRPILGDQHIFYTLRDFRKNNTETQKN